MTNSNVGAWTDNFKYQILTLQNQKVADEKCKYFPTNLIFKINYNSKAISACYDRSDALSYVELRIALSSQISILHRTSLGSQLM